MNNYTYNESLTIASVECQTVKTLPKSRNRNKPNSRTLPERAVEIMTAWYDQHYIDPYPSYRDYEQMAKLGNITVTQVKQWFINVRRRTHNQFRKKRATRQNLKSEQEKGSLTSPLDYVFAEQSSPVSSLNNHSYYDQPSYNRVYSTVKDGSFLNSSVNSMKSNESNYMYNSSSSPTSYPLAQYANVSPISTNVNPWSTSVYNYPNHYDYSNYYNYSIYSPVVLDEIKKFSY